MLPNMIKVSSKLKLNDIWPVSTSRLTRALVASLPEEEFYELCRRVYQRERRNGNNARRAREIVRRLNRYRHGPTIASRYPGLHPAMILTKYLQHDILDSFIEDRSNKWVHPTKRQPGLEFTLKDLSFVDAPEETLRQLQRIAEYECSRRDGILNFGDVQIQDIGPYVVLGLMFKGATFPFAQGGLIHMPVQKVIEAVRLREFMRMAPFEGLSDRTDVWAFKLREHAAGRSSAEPAKSVAFSIVADELVNTVNEWIGALPTPMTLTNDAMQHFNKIVTELLDNAERHGKPGRERGGWNVAGFMARRGAPPGDQDDAYDCHIAFVNTGVTIAENIQHITDENLQADLASFVSTHCRASGQSSKTLATLYAMQDGVSSLPDGRGGFGMMDMVEMANRLGTTSDPDRKPAVAIISGNSCIRFADKYCGCFNRNGGRTQLFNDDKGVASPPDSHYVFDMRHGFPRTIVAMRFSLDCQAQMKRQTPDD